MHRFPNQPVRTADGLHWNILELYRSVLEGLRKAVAAEPALLSIGIDSWAIDYGLLRATGHGDRMTSTPVPLPRPPHQPRRRRRAPAR